MWVEETGLCDEKMEVGGPALGEGFELRLVMQAGGEAAVFLDHAVVGLVAGTAEVDCVVFRKERVAVPNRRVVREQDGFVALAAFGEDGETVARFDDGSGVAQVIGARSFAFEDRGDAEGGNGEATAFAGDPVHARFDLAGWAVGGDVHAAAELRQGNFRGGDRITGVAGPLEREPLEAEMLGRFAGLALGHGDGSFGESAGRGNRGVEQTGAIAGGKMTPAQPSKRRARSNFLSCASCPSRKTGIVVSREGHAAHEHARRHAELP